MRLTSRVLTALLLAATTFASVATPATASGADGVAARGSAVPATVAAAPAQKAAKAIAHPKVVAESTTAAAPAAANYEAGCPAKPEPGFYTCYSLHRIDNRPQIAATVPAGYGPADLRSAYALPAATSAAGATQTVYVIDAFGYPNAESDLQVYRNHYGLPTCTTANGCFKKLNQNGKASPLPPYDAGWAAETALDLDMVSAVCPKCKITLIEADDNGDNLFLAVQRANALGAKYVSMSWGGPETGDEGYYDSTFFNRTGVVYSVSSGDSSFRGGNSYPATSKNAVSIGGTSLVRNGSTRGWTESTWDGTGSSCSGDEPKQKWQLIIASSVCKNRAGNDVSAVSDPNTGVAVYQRGSQYGDWSVSGGTSAAAPIIAAVYALAGPPAAGDHPASYPYARTVALNPVTTGNNGVCTPALLCTAAAGWDGPTGLGTPAGISAFVRPARVVTLTNPGDQAGSVGTAASVKFSATAAPAGTITYTAAGLPAGLSISPTTGVVSGTPTALGVSAVRIAATAPASPVASTSIYFSWKVGYAGTFTAVDAVRVLDTRNGVGAAKAIVPAGGVVNLRVLGAGGVPASGVSAVVLNVTVVQPGNAGYVTVYPGAGARPTTSNLNYVKGQTVPNLVFARVGIDGRVQLYTSAAAHLIADVSGYYLAAGPTIPGAFGALPPSRILDTRTGAGVAAVGKVPDKGTVPLTVVGRGGVPSGVSAVVMNVTATGSATSGWVTAYPAGQHEPTASSLNFEAGRTVPNLVVVPVGTDGIVELAVHFGGGTSVIADVMGYFVGPVGTGTTAGTFYPLTPARVLDSRHGTGGASSPLNSGDSVQLAVTGQGGVAASGVSAVALNVVVVNPTGAGYVTAYSDASEQPIASNLNFVRGQTVANLVVVPVGPDGAINLTFDGSGTTDLVADVAGYFYG